MDAARIASMHLPGRAVALDTETHLIQIGLPAPPLVCGSVAELQPDGTIAAALLDRDSAVRAFELALADDAITIVGANISFDMLVIAVAAARAGRNLLPAIFNAYQRGRVFDLQIAEVLHAIAEGHLDKDPRTGKKLRDPLTGKQASYSLAVVTDLVLGRTDAKRNDRYRSSYALLEDVPIAQWPEDARTYPVDDARNTLEVALAQVGRLPAVGIHRWRENGCTQCGAAMSLSVPPACVGRYMRRNLHDLAAQCFAAWALHLGGAWGFRVDGAALDVLEGAARRAAAATLPELQAMGFMRADGSEDGGAVRRAVARAYGCAGSCEVCGGTGKCVSAKTGKPINCVTCSATGLDVTSAPVPRSDPSNKFPIGQVQTGRDVLFESGDENLLAYALAGEDDKVLATYVPDLRKGVAQRVCLKANPVLDTGRVSYRGGENVLGTVQLFPRRLSAPLVQALKALAKEAPPGTYVPTGIRDCIWAPPGWVFYSDDYTGGELVTFSEACVARVGYSDLGEALNAGLDAHLALAATMLGWPYERALAAYKDKGHADHKLVKAFRQCAKWGNFGFMGGMGALKFTLTQRRQGEDTPHPSGPVEIWDGKAWVRGYRGMRLCILLDNAPACGITKIVEYKGRATSPVCKACVDAAERIRSSWFKQWREADPYLKWHGANCENVGEVTQLYSGRVRGGARFNAESNGDFQALLADVAKRAQCRVTTEQYLPTTVRTDENVACYGLSAYEGGPSPLLGSRSIFLAHDELFGEAPLDTAHDVAMRVLEVMVEEFRRACPNHWRACKAEPTIMPRWWKSAEPVWHRGRLAPWTPEHDPKTCKECDR